MINYARGYICIQTGPSHQGLKHLTGGVLWLLAFLFFDCISDQTYYITGQIYRGGTDYGKVHECPFLRLPLAIKTMSCRSGPLEFRWISCGSPRMWLGWETIVLLSVCRRRIYNGIDWLSLTVQRSKLSTPTIKPSLLKNWNTAQGHPWNEDTSLILFPPQNSIYLQPSLIWMNNIGVLISDTRMNVKPCLNLQGPPRVVRS